MAVCAINSIYSLISVQYGGTLDQAGGGGVCTLLKINLFSNSALIITLTTEHKAMLRERERERERDRQTERYMVAI